MAKSIYDPLPPASTTAAERYRQCLMDQICPICGEGPFQGVAHHTNKAHGLSSAELRVRGEIPKSRSIASRELSQEAAARAKSRDAISSTGDYVESIRGKNVHREYPEYSRRSLSANLKGFMDSMSDAEKSDFCRMASMSQSEETRKRHGKLIAEWHKKNPKSQEQIDEFVRRMKRTNPKL